jgi:hypothetical protein
MRAAAPRLLGIEAGPDARDRRGVPRIAATWRHLWMLPRPDQDWRLLFDLFWTLPDSLDADARDALQACRALAPEIVELADDLAQRLEQYAERADRHQITRPEALGDLGADPVELLFRVGDAFASFEPRCFGLGCEHADDAQAAQRAPWVRHFDARLARLHPSLSMRCEIGDTDAANILGAALGFPFSRQAVQQARNRQSNN